MAFHFRAPTNRVSQITLDSSSDESESESEQTPPRPPSVVEISDDEQPNQSLIRISDDEEQTPFPARPVDQEPDMPAVQSDLPVPQTTPVANQAHRLVLKLKRILAAAEN